MKAKVYFETTIPSYLAARPSRDSLIAEHQQLTRDWWESRGPAFDLSKSSMKFAAREAYAARFDHDLAEMAALQSVEPQAGHCSLTVTAR